MLQDYSEGTGSAAIEAEKSANNWEGSLNKLGNAFTALVQNFANSDAIITVTNSLTGLIKVLDQITSFSGPLGTLGAISGLLMNKAGIGERTSSKKYMCSREHIYYSGDLYCAHPLKVA